MPRIDLRVGVVSVRHSRILASTPPRTINASARRSSQNWRRIAAASFGVILPIRICCASERNSRRRKYSVLASRSLASSLILAGPIHHPFPVERTVEVSTATPPEAKILSPSHPKTIPQKSSIYQFPAPKNNFTHPPAQKIRTTLRSLMRENAQTTAFLSLYGKLYLKETKQTAARTVHG